jgi:ribokinase
VRPGATPRPGGDIPAQVTVGPGGQGANVAVRLARQGVSVRLLTALADDGAGRLLAAALAADGVELVRLPAARTGTVVALLDAVAERTMLSDRVSLEPSVLAAALAGAGWVHCSGYALADPLTGDALAAVLAASHPGSRVSVAGGSFQPDAAVAATVRGRLASVRPDLLIVNRDEAAAVLDRGRESLAAAAADLAAALPDTLAVVTGGPEGSAAAGHGMAIEVSPDAPVAGMLDATGAGDAYAAGMIAALLDGPWPPRASVVRDAMRRAGERGALVSQVIGAQGRIPGESDRVP